MNKNIVLLSITLVIVILSACQKDNQYSDDLSLQGTLKRPWGMNNVLTLDPDLDKYYCPPIPENCYDEIVVFLDTIIPGGPPMGFLDSLIEAGDDISITHFFETDGGYEEIFPDFSGSNLTLLSSGAKTLGSYYNSADDNYFYFAFNPSYRSTFNANIGGTKLQREAIIDSVAFTFVVEKRIVE